MIEKLVKILYFLERWGLSDRHREKILIWKYGDFHTECLRYAIRDPKPGNP
jgi:hypothetical protein